MGLMAAPAMKRSGYDVRLSAGSIAAGGTLGILIPPSVMLIVMGPVVGVPTTAMRSRASRIVQRFHLDAAGGRLSGIENRRQSRDRAAAALGRMLGLGR